MTKRVVIGYHGHCFDGMSSAAILSRFLRQHEPVATEMVYRGLDHQPGGSHVPEEILDGDINAVVDFRYSTSPRLHWWFDHHLTGIVGAEEERHYAQSDKATKFFDPNYGSCCRLIADVCRDKFQWYEPKLKELVQWAEVIDTAGFESAQTAVELKAPALQLMTVIEVHGHDGFLLPRIERLAKGESIESLAADPEVQALFDPLMKVHQISCEAIQQRAKEHNGVVSFDISHLGEGTRWWAPSVSSWRCKRGGFRCAVARGRPPPRRAPEDSPDSPSDGRPAVVGSRSAEVVLRGWTLAALRSMPITTNMTNNASQWRNIQAGDTVTARAASEDVHEALAKWKPTRCRAVQDSPRASESAVERALAPPEL
jgi:hypothetical protein